MKVLAQLNCEVFEEIAKKELDELGKLHHINCHYVFITAIKIIVHIFGPVVGPLMHEHAHLE